MIQRDFPRDLSTDDVVELCAWLARRCARADDATAESLVRAIARDLQRAHGADPRVHGSLTALLVAAHGEARRHRARDAVYGGGDEPTRKLAAHPERDTPRESWSPLPAPRPRATPSATMLAAPPASPGAMAITGPVRARTPVVIRAPEGARPAPPARDAPARDAPVREPREPPAPSAAWWRRAREILRIVRGELRAALRL